MMERKPTFSGNAGDFRLFKAAMLSYVNSEVPTVSGEGGQTLLTLPWVDENGASEEGTAHTC